jgi:hypothetical protein
VRRGQMQEMSSAGKFHFEPPFTSFDHLVGAGEQRWRHLEAERFGSFEVDYQLVFGRRLNRQVGRLLALEDAINVADRRTELAHDVGSVGDQAAAGDEIAEGVDRGQPVVPENPI